jgi:hypothetical protein
MSRKVVYNACYGGFSLSKEAGEAYTLAKKVQGLDPPGEHYHDAFYVHEGKYPRHDPDLVGVVEALGPKKASGPCAELRIKDIGSYTYCISNFDGKETVETSSEWL